MRLHAEVVAMNPFFSQFHPSEARIQEIRERQLQEIKDDRKIIVFWVIGLLLALSGIAIGSAFPSPH